MLPLPYIAIHKHYLGHMYSSNFSTQITRREKHTGWQISDESPPSVVFVGVACRSEVVDTGNCVFQDRSDALRCYVREGIGMLDYIMILLSRAVLET